MLIGTYVNRDKRSRKNEVLDAIRKSQSLILHGDDDQIGASAMLSFMILKVPR